MAGCADMAGKRSKITPKKCPGFFMSTKEK
jgi:hypothetical protein